MQPGWQEQHSFQPLPPRVAGAVPLTRWAFFPWPHGASSRACRPCSATRSGGLESSLSGAVSPRGCSALGTEDSPVSHLSAWSFSCLLASAFLPIPHTTAWTLSPGREVGQLQGSLRFVFCLSWGLLPFVALCPHCLENCCSTFFRVLFFSCIR